MGRELTSTQNRTRQTCIRSNRRLKSGPNAVTGGSNRPGETNAGGWTTVGREGTMISPPYRGAITSPSRSWALRSEAESRGSGMRRSVVIVIVIEKGRARPRFWRWRAGLADGPHIQ